MNFQFIPDTLTRIAQLGDVTLYEPAGDQPTKEKQPLPAALTNAACISHVSTPQGSKPIMKTMMTTACERNCYYCPFRAGRSKMKRVTFTPDEMAGAFDTLQRAGAADGLFLSSGIIKGSVTTQDKIIDTVEIVRNKYKYQGYVHLKIMPGAEYDQVYRAMQLADRVSINLEGPSQQRLEALAPKKDFANELLNMLQWANQIRRDNPHQKLANTVTQFVVGAVGDTDVELLSLSENLYRQIGLTRAYYSAFSPIIQTPFESLNPVDLKREHRLYQASFLLRDYGWNSEELLFATDGNLPVHLDPKHAWADAHLRHTPVDLMTADRDQLMRIPGIGPKTAALIVKTRRNHKLTSLQQLSQLGVRGVGRTAPYILLDGKKPPEQLSLF